MTRIPSGNGWRWWAFGARPCSAPWPMPATARPWWRWRCGCLCVCCARALNQACACSVLPCCSGHHSHWRVWLWVVNFLHVTRGGGPLMSASQAAAAACSLALGGPLEGTWVWPLAALALVALSIEIVLLARAGDERAVLWLVMLLVPALPLATGVHDYSIYPRFFLGSVLFLMIALASLGARAWRMGGPLRLVVAGAGPGMDIAPGCLTRLATGAGLARR